MNYNIFTILNRRTAYFITELGCPYISNGRSYVLQFTAGVLNISGTLQRYISKLPQSIAIKLSHMI